MAFIDVDTNKLRKSGNDMIQISVELNNLLEELYKKIENMPVVTGEWTGDAAIDFVKRALNDKREYINMKNTIANYGKSMISQAESIEESINSARI